MSIQYSPAKRLFIAAGIAGAVLGSASLRVPVAGADPAMPVAAPVLTALPITAVSPFLSAISVQASGLGAVIQFTSSEPTSAAVSVKPTAATNGAPVGGHLPAGAGAGIVAPTSGTFAGPDTPAPTFETSHQMKLTNLKSNTAYDVTASAQTRSGVNLSQHVQFQTAKARVRVTVDSIDITHGGALFGDNTVNWILGIDWSRGPGYQPVNSAGSASTCFPSNDPGDPTGHVVGLCEDGSYGDGTVTPLNNRGNHLSWLFAEENFDLMPTVFKVSGAANESDFFSPGQSNPEYPRGCTPQISSAVPQGVGAESTTVAVCGDDPNSTFQSLVTFRIEVFYDNLTYSSTKRNAPTNPWA